MSSGNFRKAFLNNYTIFVNLKGNKRILHHEENLETWEKTQIWIQIFITRAYILWAETPKGPTVRWSRNKNITKNIRVSIVQSEANSRSLWRSWTWFHQANSRSLWRSWRWFHQLLWNPSNDPEPRLHHCLQVGENSTSNFSALLPTTKHTNISAEST